MWQKSGRVQDLDFDGGGNGGIAAALDKPIIRSEQEIAGGGFCRDDMEGIVSGDKERLQSLGMLLHSGGLSEVQGGYGGEFQNISTANGIGLAEDFLQEVIAADHFQLPQTSRCDNVKHGFCLQMDANLALIVPRTIQTAGIKVNAQAGGIRDRESGVTRKSGKLWLWQ